MEVISLSQCLSQQLLSLLLLSNLYSDFVEALNTCTIVEASHNITGHSGCVNRWTAREAQHHF